jgi:RNA polymerase sigma-70 factor, ECF subfamily
VGWTWVLCVRADKAYVESDRRRRVALRAPKRMSCSAPANGRSAVGGNTVTVTDDEESTPELGEPIRFEDLFEAEHRRLFSALCMITRDPHEAEEVGQEAFVRLLERWDRVGSMVDPAGYLYRVAMNVLRSRYRRARVAARRLVTRSPRDEISEVDDRDAVVRMLGGLNAQQRAALVLTAMLGYSSDEAGSLLGMRGSTVRVLTTRARVSLRDQYQEAR